MKIYVVGALEVHQWGTSNEYPQHDDYDEFRFNDASTHEDHLHQDGVLTWFCDETAIMKSYICMKI